MALTGALALAPPLLAGGQERRLRIGFLGVSHSHATEKFKILRDSADFDLVGIAEETEKIREPFAKLGAQFLSRTELMDRAEVVVVESAVRDHARDALAALKAGRHVHVEKPPAVAMRECNELVRLARDQKRLLQVGYMWRFHPGINRIIEAANKGWLGDIYLVRAQMNTHLDATRRPEWAQFKGGAMFELGCHLIDAVVRLMGKPVRITPHLQRRGGDDLADNCVVVFEFAKAQAIITSAVLQPNAFPHRYFEVLGSNGMARVQPIEPATMTIELAKAAGPYSAGAQKINLPNYRRYMDEFAALATAIRTGHPLSTSLEHELVTHETLLLASEMS